MKIARTGFSIGIVFHNEGEKILASLSGLSRALSKFISGSTEPVELIFVDNCSKLNCGNIITDFCIKYHIPYKLIKNDSNNMARARNRCVAEASFDKVVFLDADCVPQEDWLTSFSELVAELSPGGFAAIGGENTPPRESSWFYLSCSMLKRNPLIYLGSTQLLPASQLKEVKHVPTCNALYLRKSILEVGGFCEDFIRVGEDLELNARLIKRGYKIYHAPGVAVEHRDKPYLREWFNKIFRYGSVQPRVLLFHGSGLDISRWVPVVLSLIILGGSWFLSLGFLASAVIFLVIISLLMIIKERQWKIGPYFLVFLSGTILSYTMGYFIGFCKIPWTILKSKNVVPLAAKEEAT